MKKRYLRLAALTAGVLLAAQTGLSAAALSTFDAAYYAAQYPDVAAVCGNDEGALLRHYLDHGIDEGRKPSADGIAGDDELSLTEAQFSSVWSPVAINKLAHYKSLKRKCTDEEFAQAYQEAEMSEDDRWRIFLDRLDGQELTTPSRLTARNFYFEDSIEAMDDRILNFYVVPCFNVDEAFGTFVETDENDHALNVYANYDMQRQQVCDELEMTLYGSGIEDQSLTYHLNAAEKEVLREKMEAYCMQREHKPLNQLCQEILQEQDAPTQEMQL